jgi:hypothetical protein
VTFSFSPHCTRAQHKVAGLAIANECATPERRSKQGLPLVCIRARDGRPGGRPRTGGSAPQNEFQLRGTSTPQIAVGGQFSKFEDLSCYDFNRLRLSAPKGRESRATIKRRANLQAPLEIGFVSEARFSSGRPVEGIEIPLKLASIFADRQQTARRRGASFCLESIGAFVRHG